MIGIFGFDLSLTLNFFRQGASVTISLCFRFYFYRSCDPNSTPAVPSPVSGSVNSMPLSSTETSPSNIAASNKNQMRRKVSKGTIKSMAATVPELVKILGGNNVIEKVLYLLPTV